MLSLLLLIPIALLLTFIGILFFLWAVRSGQYEDLDRESQEILFDDQSSPNNNLKKTNHDRKI